jgi:regulator of cell morphogenesis and NO signaling
VLATTNSLSDLDTEQLLDHIVASFHDQHRHDLPPLIALARKVESVHAAHPEAPRGLADLLMHIQAELDSHMTKEERVLFPAMRAATAAGMQLAPLPQLPLHDMRHEHLEHQQRLARLAKITNDFSPPAGACRSWTRLYAGISKLAEQIASHIQAEDDVLFPRFEGSTRS